MTIAMLTEVYRPTMNGVVVSIDTFAAELRKRGHRVVIVAPSHPGAKPERDVIRLASWPLLVTRDYRLVVTGVGHLVQILKAEGVGLLHSHHIFRLASLGLEAAQRLDLPFVQTYHTLLTEYVHYLPLPRSWSQWLMIARTRVVLNRAAHIIAPSPSIRQQLKAWRISQPISPLPTGLKLGDFRSPATNQLLKHYGIDPERPYLLFVGRLAEEKNIHLLLEVFARLHQTRPHLQLVLVGDGPSRPDIEAWVTEEGLLGSVILTGFVKKPHTNRLFGRAELFVFPSMSETQAIVIEEAMAAGAPVVAVNAYGPADAIDDGTTGRLVPNQVAPFVQAVDELLSDATKRRRMAQAAHQAAKAFSQSRLAGQLTEIYQVAQRDHRRSRQSAGTVTGVAR